MSAPRSPFPIAWARVVHSLVLMRVRARASGIIVRVLHGLVDLRAREGTTTAADGGGTLVEGSGEGEEGQEGEEDEELHGGRLEGMGRGGWAGDVKGRDGAERRAEESWR